MKNFIITEFVKFKALESTTNEQLISKADMLIKDFQKKQDGFMDAELVKEPEKNEWCFIYHYENLRKLNTAGKKMRNSNEFSQFIKLIYPHSINVSFYQKLKVW